MPTLLAQSTSTESTSTTSTTEVPRVVGDHPGTLPVVLAGLALFVVIMVAGVVASRRSRTSPPSA
jgi:hypothetical protein